jgi:signal transduction histidine kinase
MADPVLAPLNAALAINQATLEGVPLRRLFGVTARQAQAVLGASLVAVCTPAAEGTGHAVRTAVGTGARRLRGWTISAEDADRGGLRRPQARILDLDGGPWHSYLPPGLAGRLGSALLVPVPTRQQRPGLLLVAHPAGGGRFTDQDRGPAQLLASQAAVAIDYHLARAAGVRVGQLEDRERISRERQDALVQALYGVALGLQAMLPLPEAPELRRQLEGAIRDLDEVVAQLRSHIQADRPTVLPDHGLELALRQLAAQFAERSHFTIQVDVDQEAAARVAARSEQLLVIASERLSDLVRRADIAHCRVRLYQREELAVLELSDDGRGVHLEDERLREIRELVAELGGQVELEVAPELGATLRAAVHP